MTQSARDKLCKKRSEKIKVLESDFAGIKAGQRMLVATPMIVDEFIRAIPEGQHRSVRAMRNILSRRYKCDAACPVSTSIFVRMSAEAAIEAMEDGTEPDAVTPFWRILTSDEKIAKRLKIDSGWIDTRRKMEGLPLQSKLLKMRLGGRTF